MTQVTIDQNSEIERNWGMLAHLVALIPFPFFNILAPLFIWFIKKDQSIFVEANARESTNFQITVLIAIFISWWLCLFFIGFLLMLGVILSNLVFIIIAAVKAKKGKIFHYPFSLRFF